MNRTTRFLPLALALLLAAAPASAAMRWGANVFGAWNTHTMEGWNDEIDAANSSGAAFDNIENGFSFGGGPTLMVNDQWMFGLHFERLMPAKSEDNTSQVEINTAANVFGASLGYWFPTQSTMRFGMDGSLDWYNLAGEWKDPSTSLDVEGSGIGLLVRGLGSYRFNPVFSGDVSAGYRMADITIDKIGGEDPATAGLSFDKQDYNGFCVRGGLSMNFGQ